MVATVFKQAEYVVIHTDAMHISEGPSTSSLGVPGFKLKYFSGLSVGRLGVIESDFSTPAVSDISVSQLADSLGEWLAVAEDQSFGYSKFLVFGDAYGYCPVFYSLVKGRSLVISSTFSGVIAGLHGLRETPTLDLVNYVATLSALDGQFSNPTVRRTMAREVRILPLDQTLVVTSDAVNQLPRSVIQPQLSELNYDGLVAQGSELAQDALSGLAKIENLEKGLLLSGGVDSRLVLAFLTAAGIQSSFGVRTSDPRDYTSKYSQRVFERDAEIANALRSRFAMDWMPRRQAETLSTSFRESLAAFQSYRSNYSFSFKPTWALSVLKRPIVTLRGGGGEILRSTGNSKNIEKVVNGDPLLKGLDPAEQFSRWYMKSANVAGSYDESIEQLIRTETINLLAESLVESLNWLYLRTRNRTHFGHARASHSLNEIPLQVLSNVYFLEAARQMAFEEKAEGKLVKDIFRATTPELLCFPFESLEWHARLAGAAVSHDVQDPRSWVGEFDELKRRRPKAVPRAGWQRNTRGEHYAFDTESSAWTYLRAAFGLIEDVTGEKSLFRFHQDIQEAVKVGRLSIATTVAKAASAVDVFFPGAAPGTAVNLFTEPPQRTAGFSPAEINWPSLPRDGWNNIPVPELNPTISCTDSKITIEAGLKAPAEAGQSLAFYLLKDGQKVESQWYSGSNAAVFDRPWDPGVYQGKVFVRVPQSKRPVLVVETRVIRVVDEN